MNLSTQFFSLLLYATLRYIALRYTSLVFFYCSPCENRTRTNLSGRITALNSTKPYSAHLHFTRLLSSGLYYTSLYYAPTVRVELTCDHRGSGLPSHTLLDSKGLYSTLRNCTKLIHGNGNRGRTDMMCVIHWNRTPFYH